MNKDRLTAKQTIQGETDLSAFIKGAEAPYVGEPHERAEKPTWSVTRAGRPAEVAGEPRKAVVNVKFTEKEKRALTKQAHGVPLSSYVRTILKNHDII